VLLLDEPTNNLDFAGLDLLEGFLVRADAGLVVVSHDRAFLDRVVTHVLEIDEHSHRATLFTGAWTEYVAARELARSQQRDAHDRYVTERDRLLARQRTQRSWADKGVRQSRTKATDNDKNIRHFRAEGSENQAAKVRATERAIERLDAVDKPWEGWQLQLSIEATQRSGDVVARLDGAVLRRGAFRLGPLDVELRWQDRLAVLGPNGCGKSTLIAALLGTLPLESGQRWFGPSVVVGELDQRRQGPTRRRVVDESAPASVLDEFLGDTGLVVSEGRSLLAKFGLGADHVVRAPHQLSPGERTRLQLARLMAGGVNLLVLDEPTNHLDLEAIEQLEQALGTYDGTLVLVSHDRRLLEAVHVTRTLDLGPPPARR
jgi:ATPase subunit of ABC transporter with duplicated ATPase domains